MDTKLSRKRNSKWMLVNILSIVVILVMGFPAIADVSAQEPTLKVGLIVTESGIADNGFNLLAYQGLQRAHTDMNVTSSLYVPADQNGYDTMLQQCADEGNELCIAVGFPFGVSLANAARAYPNTKWGIVDYTYPDCGEGAVEGVDCGSIAELSNVRGLKFNEKQAGYLAGVLAAGMTASDIVSVVGGMEIPPVVAFVDGYRNGAQCSKPNVKVLSTYTGSFSDPSLGATTAQDMIAQGADVIFGAAGSTGDGAILYSGQNDKWAIGVDTDQYLTVFGDGTIDGSDKLLTSAMKRVDVAVYQTIKDYVNSEFTAGTVVYELANDGVGLAPFHETNGSIPQAVKDKLEIVRQGIIDGKVNIDTCPWLIAFPENDAVEAWEWPAGTTVTLTIDNAPAGFERTGIAQVTTWGDPRTYIRFDFADTYNLKIGDTVTLTNEFGATRTHTVQNLSVTDVNADTDTIKGTANIGTQVTLWPHGHDQTATVQTMAGADGAWSADFASVGFNLVPGIGGRSEVGDENGNWTAVDWNVPMDGWKQINESGFGDPSAQGVTSLAVFRGQLYAGTANWAQAAGSQIWRWQKDGTWQPVTEPGFGRGPANAGVLDLFVFQGQLYAGTGWNGEAPGQVWRSADGTKWQPVTLDGFNHAENIAVTNFVVFKDVLYAGTGSTTSSAQIWRSSTGKGGTWQQVAPDGSGLPGNVTGFAVYKNILYAAIEPASGFGAPIQVWRSINGSDWTTVTDDGFGYNRNESTGGFAQFGGYLYLGTRNEETGAQLWRTKDGLHWGQVIGDGFGDINNIKIESLLVYNDLLYAVTYNPLMGLQLWRSIDGLHWEQVTANGFGDGGNSSTLWNSATAEYQEQLLIGTWNNNEGGEIWMFTP